MYLCVRVSVCLCICVCVCVCVSGCGCVHVCAAIVDYMEKQRGDPAKPVDRSTFKSFLKVDDITVMGFFDSEKDPRFKAFQEGCKWNMSLRETC